MFTKIRRGFFGFLETMRARITNYLDEHDLCEICKENISDEICVGCDRRICGECNSGYYSDAELCKTCRADISPKEEAQDRKESAEEMAELCTCKIAGAPCELTEEEHRFVEKYGPQKAAL